MKERRAGNGKYTGKIVVDPITRVEGHLKIGVEVKNGVVKDAWSTVSLYRGIEQILLGRRPEDAHNFTQRVCGVCTNTHALTTLRAVEDAIGARIPENARLIRNLILSAIMLHDHIVHFYHLHVPDWVDMADALNADPAKAAKAAEAGPHENVKVQDLALVKQRLERFVQSGQLGIITNAYFLGGHPSYSLSPEMNLVMTANYFKALEVQRRLGQAMAVFGSKNPHSQTMIVGGVTCYNALNKESIEDFRTIWDESRDFILGSYIPDLAVLGEAYPEWAGIGGNENFFAVGDFADADGSNAYLEPGVVMGGDLEVPEEFDPGRIEEHVARSWYRGDEARHPYEGETEPEFTSMEDEARYSWTKAPRYRGAPMEVGPLARVLVHMARGGNDMADRTGQYLEALGLDDGAMFSTLGRTAARGLESAALVVKTYDWIDELSGRISSGDTVINTPWTMPKDAKGVGWAAVPRGELSHWIRIEDGRIGNFQMVVPSTWNCGPRCAEGRLGPVESSLLGTPVADAERPVELLRTVHSFDPCLACSVHLIEPRSNRNIVVRAV
jgi:[NiFe] hydrogenase large subunit